MYKIGRTEVRGPRTRPRLLRHAMAPLRLRDYVGKCMSIIHHRYCGCFYCEKRGKKGRKRKELWRPTSLSLSLIFVAG